MALFWLPKLSLASCSQLEVQVVGAQTGLGVEGLAALFVVVAVDERRPRRTRVRFPAPHEDPGGGVVEARAALDHLPGDLLPVLAVADLGEKAARARLPDVAIIDQADRHPAVGGLPRDRARVPRQAVDRDRFGPVAILAERPRPVHANSKRVGGRSTVRRADKVVLHVPSVKRELGQEIPVQIAVGPLEVHPCRAPVVRTGAIRMEENHAARRQGPVRGQGNPPWVGRFMGDAGDHHRGGQAEGGNSRPSVHVKER